MFLAAAPVTRTVAGMPIIPSTRQPTIRARCSVLSLAILTVMLDRLDLSTRP